MSLSELPPPPEVEPGLDLPHLQCRPPGPQSRSWLTRLSRAQAPMGPAPRAEAFPRQRIEADVPPGAVVFATGKGSNLLDVDGNRYVDLAAGFGAMLVGHGHPSVRRRLELQLERLTMALGDVHPADAKVALVERLAGLHADPSAGVIVGQSGSDAVTAALKTAALATGRPGVLAFEGAYHGLGYGPVSLCGLRSSYSEPFRAQLNAHVEFAPYPGARVGLDETLERAKRALATGEVGAVVVEPILGRGGCVVPPTAFLPELGALAREAGALVVVDEIWTGLGRSGSMLYSRAVGFDPDVICLGKGLGGGIAVSACIGRGDVMGSWRRQDEVVHTSTFAGAPLGAAAALALLDVLSRERLVERSARLGRDWQEELAVALSGQEAVVEVRGAGLMIGVELRGGPGAAVRAQRMMLERGFVVSTGGGSREVLVLTPALTVGEGQLVAATEALAGAVRGLPS